MRKAIIVTFLLLFLSVSFSYILLYYSFNLTTKNNYLNKNFRLKVASIPLLKKAFKLHQAGDNRFDYFYAKNYQKLEITIYSAENFTFSEDFKSNLKEKISQIVNKPAGIIIREESLSLSNLSDLTDDDLSSLIKSHPDLRSDSAVLSIFILGSYAPAPTYAGLVKDASHIFIFTDPIKNVSHFEKTSDNTYLSTILHEFAHLLGAGHVTGENCLLSERVEDMQAGRPILISSSFCPEDMEEIQKRQKLIL